MKLATHVIALTALAIGAAIAADNDAIRKDTAGLQGEWTMVSGSADGQPMPDQMLNQSKRVCKGDETTTTIAGRLLLKAKFTIDPSKMPKTIDYEMTDGFTKGKKQLGIYELNGDTFKSCFGAAGTERPGDFTSAPGDRRTLSVWQREKTAAQPTEAGPVVLAKNEKPNLIKELNEDGTLHRITGKVEVLDAHTIAFEDGTAVDLNGVMDAPELEQKAMIGDSLYPCGKEAADFLKKLIGDQTVTFLSFGSKDARPRGNCYAGETYVQEAMVRAGWAVSTHSGTELPELIAKENKRGLWRGKFVTPKSWRKGDRLPGE